MTLHELYAMSQMSDADWRFALSMFSDSKIADLVGCSVDAVAKKRKELIG